MSWPILTRYDANHLTRIALPLGGIGTGTVSLGGRGDLRDFEVYSHPDKGFTPSHCFFALWIKPSSGKAITRCLEGVIEPWLYEGASGCPVPNHGLPRFRHCTFAAAYPLGQVFLSDPAIPLTVRLEAFNPLVPADPDASGIPAAILRYVLTNPTDQAVTASVCGNLQNFIGNDGANGKRARGNTITFRQSDGLSGLFYQPGDFDPHAEEYGTLALVTLTPIPSPKEAGAAKVTHRLAWDDIGWNTGLLDFWDDFSADGRLAPRPNARSSDTPVGSLAVQVVIPPHAEQAIIFLLTWHFANRKTWTPCKPGEACTCPPGQPDFDTVGNYYATQSRDAWEVASHLAARLPHLEERTVRFVRAFCESDLPQAVKEAALFNLSTLRTQTTFRTPDGRLFGWEGCNDKAGCCHGSCTHVWNYEQSTAFLFGSLARTMREVEFAFATDENGLMSFRSGLPLVKSREWPVAAADGQMGCIMKLYREWQLCGDDDWLRTLWPKARKALEFCWIPGGWDADQDGVMEGCQHNTMDVEYYGPNPQMQTWYLGALRAAEEMAWHLGDYGFAEHCNFLFQSGSQWTDQHLFNGEYYEHQVRPPKSEAEIAPGLRAGMGAANLTEPAYQVGTGCLADQLVGQHMAHVCGLGYLLKPAHVRQALRTIYQYNRQKDFHDHFNNMRSYALGDEAALLVCSYPRGNRPRQPFPYAAEAWTGLEYTAAAGMIYEGQVSAGLRVVADVRKRYDGRKRSPFDEAECGHHYARAMAAWGAVLALTGFNYSAVDRRMGFKAQEGKWFWSNGYGWGECFLQAGDAGWQVTLTLLGGALTIEHVILSGVGAIHLDQPLTLEIGQPVSWFMPKKS